MEGDSRILGLRDGGAARSFAATRMPHLRFLLSAVLLAGLALLIDWSALMSSARLLSWPVLAAAGLALVMQVIIGAWRAQFFLRLAGYKPERLLVLQAYALSVIANAFLINFVAGAVARVVLLRHRVVASASLATVLVEKVVIVATLVGLAAIGAVALAFWQARFAIAQGQSVGIGLVVSAVIVAAAATVRLWARPFLRILRGWIRSTFDQSADLIGRKATWIVGGGMTLLSTLCAWAAYTCLGIGIGIEGAPERVAVILPLVAIAASLPVSIGGWGVREASFAGLFLSFGVPKEQSVIIPAVASLLAVAAAFTTAFVAWIVRQRID